MYIQEISPVIKERIRTYCYNCGKILIKRYSYNIEKYNIEDGKCKYCQTKIDGVKV